MSRIVFFGNERLATGVSTDAPTLRGLLAAGYDIAAVVSHHTDGRSRVARRLEIAAVAEEHGIPLLLPEKPAEILDQLQALRADIGVLVAYGKIVPQSVIDIFPSGIINIHPSLLPQHRGPIPIESVMLDGSARSGVSIMQLVRAMDAGPVYGQRQLALSGTETKQELARTLLERGGELLLKLLPAVLDGSLQPAPQDDTAATFDALITKEDGILNFRKPAALLAREIRAYLGWPGSRTRLGSMDVIITAAHVLPATDDTQVGQPGEVWREDKTFGLYSSYGSVLVIDSLKPAGKQEMTAQAFLNGYGKDI